MGDTKGVGCGAWPVILKNTKFFESCRWHDEAYTQGSFFQREKWTRAQVDEWFYGQLRRIAKSPWDRFRAELFYGIVRVFGGVFWEGES